MTQAVSGQRSAVSVVLATLCVLGAGRAMAEERVQLLGIRVARHQSGDHHQVIISTSGNPRFAAYPMHDPPRLVIDFSGSDGSKIDSPIRVEAGGIDQIAVQQFRAHGLWMARVTVGLLQPMEHDIRQDGNAVHIDISPLRIPIQTLVGGTEAVRVASLGAPVSDATAHLLAVRGQNHQVVVEIEGEPEYRTEIITDPPRLVIDLLRTGRRVARREVLLQTPWARRARVGAHGRDTRVVIDLLSAFEPRVLRSPTGLVVSSAGATGSALRVQDVTFETKDGTGRLTVTMNGAVSPEIDTASGRSWLMKIPGVGVPKDLQRTRDALRQDSPVRSIAIYEAGNPSSAHVVVNLRAPATQSLHMRDGGLVWEIAPLAGATLSATEAVSAFDTEDAVEAEGEEAAEPVDAPPTEDVFDKASSKLVTFDARNTDIVELIRVISEISGRNIIISETVSGKVTMKLRNVPWEQVLDQVLRSRGFGTVEKDGIIRVASSQEIQTEKENEIKKRLASRQVEDVVIKIIAINYATASEILGHISPMLTPERGKASTDARTNTIILEEVESNVDRIVELVRRLDRQTPQIRIEARIVEAGTNFNQDMGIQWGGGAEATTAAGNPTGLRFPGNITVMGAGEAIPGIGSLPSGNPGRFAVNFPPPVGEGLGTGLGFIFGSAGGTQLLSLRIGAMEASGRGRLISSPSITTLDNRAANITQGVDIPITVTSAAGANTTFASASLSLQVTPHVTNDGSILLDISVSKNSPSPNVRGADGTPGIDRKQATTNVLVRNGDTVVIAGIYTRDIRSEFDGVPVLSHVPILGWLFKHENTNEVRTELLVFITPMIVNREESMVPVSEPLQAAPTADADGADEALEDAEAP